MKFFSEILPNDFVQNYWEQKPLLIQNAFSIPNEVISNEDIQTMLTDEYFETRLVQELDEKKILTHGPIEEKDFPDKNQLWTILIHNLNLYNEFANDLHRHLDILPNWLFDDVMASYSTKDSTLGAHFDLYSVFILQVSGQRRWRIQNNPNKKYKEDQDIKVLEYFDHDSEYILNPGDMIYIPPGVAHEGFTLEDSFSYSIGSKSLETKDIAQSLSLKTNQINIEDELIPTKDFLLYEKDMDKNIVPMEYVELIANHIKENISRESIIANTLKAFSKPNKQVEDNNDYLKFEEFIDQVKNKNIYLDEFIRVCAYKDEKNNYEVAINQKEFSLNKKEYIYLTSLLSSKEEEHTLNTNFSPDLYYQLYLCGELSFSD